MAATLASSALTVPKSQETTYTDQQLEILVNKLTTLRNDILAGSHPRLKLPAKVSDKGRPQSAVAQVTASFLPGLSNHTLKPVPPFGSPLPRPSPNSNHITSQDGSAVLPEPTAALSTTASSINPIFLEKSDALVKAEAQMKRERLEHALEDQAQQKKKMMRNKTHDEFAMPSFQIDDVLRRAHELVKPLCFRRDGHAIGNASSTDSFDENTFYSSQMNESTSTEGEIVEVPKRHPRPKLCRFFLNGKSCPYGENCQFSHDPSMKARIDGSSVQARDTNQGNGGEETNSRPNNTLYQPLPPNGNDGKTDQTAKEPNAQQQRIAQLEAELAAMKAQEGQDQPTAQLPKSQENPRHIATGPDEFGRDISLRDQNAQHSSEVDLSRQNAHSTREYSRHDRILTPPSSNNVRVVRSHITSPYAPQPARVSPLAVAKVSQVQQIQAEGNRTSRIPYAEVVSDGSPNVSAQPLNPKKRRRGRDFGEQNRNVAPRRETSPQIRIKEEPVSPPSFDQASLRPLPLQDAQRTLYMDARARPQERAVDQIRVIDRPDNGHEAARPGRRLHSRNSQHYISKDEPDLRRIVSERQLRAPISPSSRYVQYSEPQPRIIRASSQAHIPPPGQRNPVSHRVSMQPQPATHGRSPSPLERQVQSPPLGPLPVSMAPPPRRVVVDQYGNRFLEPEARQPSLAPVSRPSTQLHYDQYANRVPERYSSTAPRIETRYEQQPLRSQSVRYTYGENDATTHQAYRQPSPVSPTYVEYTRPVQVVEPRNEGSGGDNYDRQYQGPRVIYQQARPSSSYEQANGYRDGHYRVQTALPADDRYEQTSRMQSVQPQPQIVQVIERQPAVPQMSRQVSLRPDDGYSRQVSYAREPQYQYMPHGAQSGGYISNEQDDMLYDPLRPMQRM